MESDELLWRKETTTNRSWVLGLPSLEISHIPRQNSKAIPEPGRSLGRATLECKIYDCRRNTVIEEHKLFLRITSWDGSIQFSSLLLDYFRWVADACLAAINEAYTYTVKLKALRLPSGTGTTGMEQSISVLLNSLAFLNRMAAASNLLHGNAL